MNYILSKISNHGKLICIIMLSLLIFACSGSFLSNPCRESSVIEDIKNRAALFLLLLVYPEQAFDLGLKIGHSFFEEESFHSIDEEIRNALSPIINELRIDEIGKSRKVSEGVYECNIILEFRDNKYLVNSLVKELFKGRSGKIYGLEDFKITPISK